jgi:hypothetical protein
MKARPEEVHTAHGRVLRVTQVRRYTWHLQVDGERRCRWAGYRREVREDLAHFQATGSLPPPSGTSWA